MFSRVVAPTKSIAKAGLKNYRSLPAQCFANVRQFSAAPSKDDSTPNRPIYNNKSAIEYETSEKHSADHLGRQVNHIWNLKEIDDLMNSLYRHKPQNFADHVVNKVMYGLYHTFNFITGYKDQNPTVKAIEWRLIVLESIAGVPGFVAAGFRHFKSLRQLQRDHGWISTLLEEAENERMHLLVCLKMFNASPLTRFLVIAAQFTMTPVLMATYLVKPQAMHRFVGYLEETACHTYKNVIRHIETPGTHLNKEWSTLVAPEISINYWKLPRDAMWVDTLKCMFADETHHRDVNHTFAEMKMDDPNPFVHMHRENTLKALQMEQSGERSWPERNAQTAAAAAFPPASGEPEKK